MKEHSIDNFTEDLKTLGIEAGDTVMMHSSFRSLGGIEDGAAGVFKGFEIVLGSEGTLVLPALSYESVDRDHPVFDRAGTPSCVGYLSEYFRTQVPGVIRSMHATHSCCAKGKLAAMLTENHELDLTPVGGNSPIAKLPKTGGKILFLGCSADHDTALHGVEELVVPPYLYEDVPIEYILRDGGREIRQNAKRHSFCKNGIYYEQNYSRVVPLLKSSEYSKGKVLDADCLLLSAEAVWRTAEQYLRQDPLYFVIQENALQG